MKIAAGLRQLLSQAIDYAGLFPPAKLPLEQAIHHYAHYRTDADTWLLGRFVIQASRLGELEAFVQLFGEGPAFLFTALGRGGESATALLAGLSDDLQAVGAFQKRHPNTFVDVLELKWPKIPLGEVLPLFESVAACVEKHKGPLTLTPYFELGLGEDWRGTLTGFVSTLKHFREDSAFLRRRKCRQPGLKLRCGGLNAEAIPSAEQVAAVLHCCLAHRVPVKCTAGLHHALRKHNASMQTKMHGFINVFAAGVLGQVHNLDESQLQAILEDEDAAHFVCDKHGFAWKQWHATAQEVAFARREAIVAFGSCSFEEPRDELRMLGWLPDKDASLAPDIGGEA